MLVAVAVIALLPAVMCAVLLGALRVWRLEDAPRLAWATPLAVAAGFVAVQLAVDGAPRVPPLEAAGWFSPLAMALCVFAIAVKPRLGPRRTIAGTVLVALAMVVVIVHPLVGGAWTPVSAVLWIAGMTAVTSVVASLVDRHTLAGPAAPLSLLVTASGVAGVLTLCGSARYGQLGGAVASTMGPLVLVGLLRRETAVLGQGAWLSTMVLAMLVVAGVAYVDIPVHIALAVMAAPLGILVGGLPALTRWRWWTRDLARCAAVLGIVALAMALAAAGQSTAY